MKKKSIIDNSLLVLYLSSLATALFFKSAIVAFIAFLFIILIDKKYIIPTVLTTPSIETILVATEGLTVTKLLAGFLITYFTIEIYKSKINILNKYTITYFVFIYLTIIAAVIGTLPLFGQEFISAINYNLIVVLPKIIFSLLVFLYFTSKGFEFFSESILFSVKIITYSVIVVFGYFIFFGYSEIEWGLTVIRRSLEGADPNEFSGIAAALCVFPLYWIFNERNFLAISSSLVSFAFVFYGIILTLSRGGIFSIIFTILLFISIFGREKVTRTSLIIISGLTAFSLFIYLGIIDVFAITERFTGRFIKDTTSLTAGRSDLFLAGIDAFFDKPIFGHGNSHITNLVVTFEKIAMDEPIHNTFIEFMVRYGTVGFIVFMFLLYNALTSIYLYFSNYKILRSINHIILPSFSLMVILFAGLALSWQWRDILWYLIGLSTVSTFFISNKLKSSSV